MYIDELMKGQISDTLSVSIGTDGELSDQLNVCPNVIWGIIYVIDFDQKLDLAVDIEFDQLIDDERLFVLQNRNE